MVSANRVLLITHDFPPVGGPSVKRVAKFAKYLGHFGWNVSVLTTRVAGLAPLDSSRLDDLRGIQVHRTPAPKLFLTVMRLRRLLGGKFKPEADMAGPSGKRVGPWDPRAWLIPDAKILWVPFGLLWALTRRHHDRSDVVMSTIPTPSAAVVGWLIARAWHVPHVVDFRDPWADAHFLPRRAKLAGRLERALEKRILVHASVAVVTQDEWRREIRALVSPATLPIETIMNGFDEADFKGLEAAQSDGRFLVVHTGMLFHRGIQSTNLSGLRLAVGVLADKAPRVVKDMHFVQLGPVDRTMRRELDLLRQFIRVSIRPLVPHREAIEQMLGADVLYLPVPGNTIRSKTFEYLRAGRPILAVGDDLTNTRDLLAEMGLGKAFATADAAPMACFLEQLW